MSQQDIYSNLLGQGKKGGQSYSKKVNEIQLQIQLIKNKNNLLQKQSDNDIDGDIKKEIYQQSKFIEHQINKIKKLLTEFSQQFKDPTSKNKLKQFWKSSSKQIQRNKVIMERLVNEAPNQSFIRDRTSGSSILDNKPRRSRNSLNRNQVDNMMTNNNIIKPISEQQYDQTDLKIQQDIQKQKKQLLNHLQQKNMKINKIMNEMALMVEEQGDHINIVTDNIKQAKQNTQQTNNQLDGAIQQQKKARRKYCCIAGALIILSVLVVGVVLMLYFNNE